MRKALIGGIALLAAAALLVPATALADDTFKFHGGLTNRYEYLSNFTDLVDSDPNGPIPCPDGACKDTLNYVFYRAIIGMSIDVNDTVAGYFEIQNVGTWGNSLFDQNAQDPVIGNLQFTSIAQNNQTELYQAYFDVQDIGGTNFDAKIGRQEKVLGNELMIGDQDFYSGFYMDGINLRWDTDRWAVDFMYYKIAERDLFPGALLAPTSIIGGSNDENLWGLTFDWKFGDDGVHGVLQPYLLYRQQQNLGHPLKPEGDIGWFGILYNRNEDHPSHFDWSAELTYNFGEYSDIAAVNPCPTAGTGTCDVAAFAAEGWFGYTFGDEDASHHRIHLGVLYLSGGDPATDTDIKFFQPLYPDTHDRAGLMDAFTTLSSFSAQSTGSPAFGFTNLLDINLGWRWSNNRHGVTAVFHNFTCADDASCVALGLPEGDLGNEIDLVYDLMGTTNIGLQAGLAYFATGAYFDDNLAPFGGADNVTRIWIMGNFRM